MVADSSTLAAEYRASPHRNSNCTEHRLNIEPVDDPLSSEGPVEFPVLPATTPMSIVAPPPPLWTPLSTDADPTTLPKCETEFRNLMAFRGMDRTKENLCRVALEHWQSSAELMGKRVEKREKEIRSTRNEIYQVVGFYSAFQGLLLTAIAQSNLLHWNNRGYPLALSALATGIAATGVVQKNKIISDWKKTLASENPARKAFIHRVDRLRAEGINFPFQDVYEGECKLTHPQTKLARVYSFLFNYETLVVATLMTFGALCVASMLQILRHPDIPPQQ